MLATFGLGPTEAHFVARTYPPNALAELSWGDFSRVALARPSVMMQWLRIPTIAGLACGLIALAWAAFGDLAPARRTVRSAPGAPAAVAAP